MKYSIAIPVIESFVYVVWAKSQKDALEKVEKHMETEAPNLPSDKDIRCSAHGGQVVINDVRAWTVREL